MSDKKEESLKYLRAALESGEERFDDAEKAQIWLEIALAEKHDDESAAADAARHVQRYAKIDSAAHLQADVFIANVTLSGKALTDRLLDIEKRARSKGQVGVGNSVALTLYEIASKPLEELRHLQRVLDSGEPGYNRIRALVDKGEVLRQHNRLNELKAGELSELTNAYTYLHAQRFGGLFDRCHSALWDIFEAMGDSQRLLRLFRHSSFLWRIRGRDDEELHYLQRLNEAKVQERTVGKTVVLEFSYFLRRLRVILHVAE